MSVIPFLRASMPLIVTPWIIARPESQELLAICLKKLKGLNKVRLTEAHFIWTEPHSKRLRVSMTIQKEVLTSTILEQIFEIEYLVQHGQCPDCTKLAAKNTWKALVQVRQKVPHKRTFLFLEQLILKNGAQKDTISVKEVRDGLDFFYSSRSHALKMVEFFGNHVPVRSKASERLLSSDTHTNTASFKHTYSAGTPAREHPSADLVRACRQLGAPARPCDSSVLRDHVADILARAFESLANVGDMVEFTVLDVEPTGATRGKWVLADAQVALSGAFRSTGLHEDDGMMDFESSTLSNQIFHTRTHLGAILQPGDTVLGYHLSNTNFNSDEFANLPQDRIPDIVLVKKSYPNRRKKNRTRNWKLRSIAKEAGEEGETGGGRGVVGRMGGRDQRKVEQDYELFLRDIEEDPEMRGAVNLYKAEEMKSEKAGSGLAGGKTRKQAQFSMEVDEGAADVEVATAPTEEEESEEEEPDFPEMKLDELLDEFDEMTLREEEE
ncbi:hypothetical protein EWM64_g1468 [Hericium alpestre]|uniref:60S ribosomal export protein NMD3 n=1 Tax=Hericium alpestre TaxID=135208 RepID=A0A4Z0A685_9AGAM|nr:hypothetical protein EWM64_g1468 [Hericium alpestre]